MRIFIKDLSSIIVTLVLYILISFSFIIYALTCFIQVQNIYLIFFYTSVLTFL